MTLTFDFVKMKCTQFSFLLIWVYGLVGFDLALPTTACVQPSMMSDIQVSLGTFLTGFLMNCQMQVRYQKLDRLFVDVSGDITFLVEILKILYQNKNYIIHRRIQC